MKSLISLLLVSGLFYAAVSNAATVSTAGQAMTICKAEAKANNDDYVGSKSKRIKQNRSGFTLDMRVLLADKSVVSKCKVERDGTVTYTQS